MDGILVDVKDGLLVIIEVWVGFNHGLDVWHNNELHELLSSLESAEVTAGFFG